MRKRFRITKEGERLSAVVVVANLLRDVELVISLMETNITTSKHASIQSSLNPPVSHPFLADREQMKIACFRGSEDFPFLSLGIKEIKGNL